MQHSPGWVMQVVKFLPLWNQRFLAVCTTQHNHYSDESNPQHLHYIFKHFGVQYWLLLNGTFHCAGPSVTAVRELWHKRWATFSSTQLHGVDNIIPGQNTLLGESVVGFKGVILFITYKPTIENQLNGESV